MGRSPPSSKVLNWKFIQDLKIKQPRVHDCTAQKCDAEKCRTGVLKHFDPSIVVHKEDGDEAAQGAEHGDAQED